MWVIEYEIATHCWRSVRNDKEGKAGISVEKKDKYKDAGINEGIQRQRVRAIEYVIATPAFGRLAMTGERKSVLQ